MADSTPFLNRLSPSIVLSADTSVATAKQAVEKQNADFLIVESPTFQTLVSAEYLTNERSVDNRSLAELAELPSLVALAANWEVLSTRQVESLHQALEITGAHGILVYQTDKTLGVLSAKALETEVTTGIVRVSKGSLDGTSSVSFQTIFS